MRPDHRLDLGMVEAKHREAIKGHILDKALERIAHGVEVAVKIKMIRVLVGDLCDGRRQAKESAVALVCFHNDPFARAQPRIGAIGVDDAAIDHGRVHAACIEQRRNHRRGRGLAVGAGDRDAGFEPHDFGEHLGAPDERQAQSARGVEFDIAGLDRRGIDHNVGVLEIAGRVADRDLACPWRAGVRTLAPSAESEP